jgi:hypothetical protein
MKNITITLDEGLARWARVEAAKAGKSVSRFVADLLAARRGSRMSQREAVDKFLSLPDLPGIAADYPSREELYAERLFHRYKHSPLRKGPDRSRQAKKSAGLARRIGK